MELKSFPNYDVEQKEVKIFGTKYNAFFPKEHTNIKAVVLECEDLNAGDSYANITRYYLKIFVLEKGASSTKWMNIYNGLKKDYHGELDTDGVFPLLFSLEDSSFRKRWLRKNEIKELKNQIKNSQKRLEELLVQKN